MNIFLTPALPHGRALQSLHKGEGCLYEGGYNERSPDSRMSTLTISLNSLELFKMFIILGQNQKLGLYLTDLQVTFSYKLELQHGCEHLWYSLEGNLFFPLLFNSCWAQTVW